MEQLNEYAGLIAIVSFGVLFLLCDIVICMLISLSKKLSVQRLKFMGQFSADPDTRKVVADITVSNRALYDVTVTELGLINGKVNFSFTDVYKKQNKLAEEASIVVGQRGAIRLILSAEDLAKALVQNARGKVILKKIYFYAMDSAGISYKGKIPNVRKLLVQIAKSGVDYLPPAFKVRSANQSAPKAGVKNEPKREVLERTVVHERHAVHEEPVREVPAYNANNAGGEFGAPAHNQGEGFGAPAYNANGGFGAPAQNQGEGFGAPAYNANDGFGAPAYNANNAGGEFGAPAYAPQDSYGFGANTGEANEQSDFEDLE